MEAEANGKPQSRDPAGERYIVERVLICNGENVIKVPLMAFDTPEEADAFASEEQRWQGSIPTPMQMFLGKIGIKGLGLNRMSIPTQAAQRQIILAPAGALGPLMKPVIQPRKR